MLYRIKQFYWSFTARINKEDIKFINKYLNYEEIKLFNSLAHYEQKHSVNVARDVIEECEKRNIKSNILIKAALFHDLGKAENKLNIIDKSIIVLLDKITGGKLKQIKVIKKIYTYYNHGEMGYEQLKPYGYDERLLYLIRNHHRNNIHGDVELEILRLCDNKN